ncbi:MAG TPA: MarR family transcriptional regulator [Ignavibacteria bacterium]|nr:MarR family transcriptional regulator [Ignavibacteria bacterium]
MKIEDEIKQENFKSEYQKLAINLIFTGNWIHSKNAELLKPHKLTSQQFNLLRILRGQFPNPVTVNLLIERMLDKMSNASRIVDRLVKKNLVLRKSCPEDRRRVDIVITDKGLKLLEKIDLDENKWEKRFENLTEIEAKNLNNYLDKLRG